MTEPLTLQLVVEELRRLHVAFPQNIGMRSNPSGTAEVYRNGLRGLSGSSLRVAVDRCIQDEQYFPKVAKLREIAGAWTKHNEAPTVLRPEDELDCPNCRTRAEFVQRWRPRIDPERHNRKVLSADGLYLMLERYERLLCKCAAPCAYAPIDGLSEPMMRLDPPPSERDEAADD